MKAIEKLARDICWAGFTHPDARRGKTRASYWKDIHEDARRDYIREAERVVWLLFRPGILDAINAVRAERKEIVMLHGPRSQQLRSDQRRQASAVADVTNVLRGG